MARMVPGDVATRDGPIPRTFGWMTMFEFEKMSPATRRLLFAMLSVLVTEIPNGGFSALVAVTSNVSNGLDGVPYGAIEVPTDASHAQVTAAESIVWFGRW